MKIYPCNHCLPIQEVVSVKMQVLGAILKLFLEYEEKLNDFLDSLLDS